MYYINKMMVGPRAHGDRKFLIDLLQKQSVRPPKRRTTVVKLDAKDIRNGKRLAIQKMRAELVATVGRPSPHALQLARELAFAERSYRDQYGVAP
jgi:hypothetical protein